jgi:glycoside/pentoside/hexuronide:cation symporter, GPH family
MEQKQTQKEDIVPFGQKLAFGAGSLANQLFPAAVGAYMGAVVIIFGMDPYLAGILSAIPRFIDAILDPIMGYISDNTRSKWGRRKPYIFIGSIVTSILFVVMWQLFIRDQASMFNFWYILIISLFFYIGLTVFAAPLIGLGYELTPDYNERTRLMAVSQFLGQFAWMISPWFLYIIYNFYGKAPEMAAEGSRHLAIYIGVLCLVLGILPALFCKEVDQTNITGQSELSFKNLAANMKNFFKGFAETIKNGPFLRLCGATFCVFNGFQLVASFSVFIIMYYVFPGIASQDISTLWIGLFGTVSSVATAFLVIPIITFISGKVGKRNAFIISILISTIGYILKWWAFQYSITEHWMMFIPLPLISFGIGGLFTLMMSMTADVCDYDELLNGMPRKEATFGAIYWWMVKLGTSLAVLFGGFVLSGVGFDPSLHTQTVATLTKLRLADIVIPAITGLLAIAIMWRYDISEKKAKEIREELIRRRGNL